MHRERASERQGSPQATNPRGRRKDPGGGRAGDQVSPLIGEWVTLEDKHPAELSAPFSTHPEAAADQ